MSCRVANPTSCILWLGVVFVLFCGSIRAQDLPPKPTVLNIASYSEITVAMWQQNNDVAQEKIILADSLYQMPDSFYAAEQGLNDQLQAWQDSVMAELNTDIAAFMKFGVANKKKIEAFLQESGMHQQLDSLRQASDALFADYENRLQGYNLAGPSE